MKSGGQGEAEAAAAKQLAAEMEWLAGGHLPAEFLATLPEPSPAERDIIGRVQGILSDPRLAPFLRIIEQHNSKPRELPGRRLPQKDHFLLGPHLRQVLVSVQARNEVHQKLPVLDLQAAKVREHLQNVAASCKDLAELIRKGPQPHVALAGKTSTNAALKVFAPWTELFEASDGSERQVVAFTELMERAAGWFDALADDVPRAEQHRRAGEDALMMYAAEFLVGVFRKGLDKPYHAHVATIAGIVSGLEICEETVKKLDHRRLKTNRSRGQK